MKEKIKAFIEKNELIRPNSTLVLALSGGPDSVALLDVLYNLRKEFGLKLVIAHLNHSLRGNQSDLDEEFVKKLAKEYGLILETEKIELEKSDEKTARRKRYQFFFRVAKKHKTDQIALGHNRSDQLETVLFNFVRGSGLKGLAGMKAKSKRGGCYLIRPLLTISRDKLINYLNEKDKNYRLDPSNVRLDYTRNKIRHQIVPELKELNPNLEKLITDKAMVYKASDEYLAKKAKEYLNKNNVSDKKIVLDQKSFLSLPLILKYYTLLVSIEKIKGDLIDLKTINLEEVLDIFSKTSSQEKRTSFKGLKFVKKSGKLTIAKVK